MIGVPDEKWGETVKALVVLATGRDARPRPTLIAHCRRGLAHYKCPTSVEFGAALPRTATGKVQKFRLRRRSSPDPLPTRKALPMSLFIRAATPGDTRSLARLAGLDSRAALRGHALVAELDGLPVAAVGLTSGTVIADPFVPTVEAVRALRERRYRMLRQGGDVGTASALLRRVAPVRPRPVGRYLQALIDAEARA